MTGIVKMVQDTLQAAFYKTLQKNAHHSFVTLQMLEQIRFLVWRGALKIRVSMVRFRPRPPLFKGNRSRLPFHFSDSSHATRGESPICMRCAVYSAVAISGRIPLFRFLSVLCSQKTGPNHVDAGTRRTTFCNDTYTSAWQGRLTRCLEMQDDASENISMMPEP